MRNKSVMILFFFVFTILALTASSFAESKKNLPTWYSVNFPPFYITSGPYKDQGYVDKSDKFVLGKLKGYDFQEKIGNLRRVLDDMKNGKKACISVLMFTPEREKLMYFSLPSLLNLPLALITTKKNLKLFGNKKSVNFEDILKNKKLKMGIAGGRSLGSNLDPILKKYEGNSNIIVRKTGRDISEGLLQMLLKNRIDYTVEYPSILMYQIKNNKIGKLKDFAILSINEVKKPSVGHMTCTKSPWGKKVIKEVNKILSKTRASKEYRSIEETWVPAESLDTFRDLYKNVFLKDMRTTVK